MPYIEICSFAEIGKIKRHAGNYGITHVACLVLQWTDSIIQSDDISNYTHCSVMLLNKLVFETFIYLLAYVLPEGQGVYH